MPKQVARIWRIFAKGTGFAHAIGTRRQVEITSSAAACEVRGSIWSRFAVACALVQVCSTNQGGCPAGVGKAVVSKFACRGSLAAGCSQSVAAQPHECCGNGGMARGCTFGIDSRQLSEKPSICQVSQLFHSVADKWVGCSFVQVWHNMLSRIRESLGR